MVKMQNRFKEKAIVHSVNHFPSVGILGPRQCGKTTIAKKIMSDLGKKAIYLDLESERDLAVLSSPELFFEQHYDDCIILDEVQVKPDLFPVLRSSIDKHRVPGRFILLGSSSPNLLRSSNESLSGRVVYHELSPFNVSEIEQLTRHRIWGGYPECHLFPTYDLSVEWLENYINSYVNRELPALGLNTSPITIRKLLSMIAHVHGNLLNTQQLSSSLGVSASSVKNYLDFLEGAFLIRRLQPFYVNMKKRLVKSPKIYIRDAGILHYLLGFSSSRDYEFSPYVGASWEGYVIEQVLQALPKNVDAYFYRTHQGTECDLIIAKGQTTIICVEVKYTLAPSITKGFGISIDDLSTKDNYIIVPREEDYLLREDVKVMGITNFLKEVVFNL